MNTNRISHYRFQSVLRTSEASALMPDTSNDSVFRVWGNTHYSVTNTYGLLSSAQHQMRTEEKTFINDSCYKGFSDKTIFIRYLKRNFCNVVLFLNVFTLFYLTFNLYYLWMFNIIMLYNDTCQTVHNETSSVFYTIIIIFLGNIIWYLRYEEWRNFIEIFCLFKYKVFK